MKTSSLDTCICSCWAAIMILLSFKVPSQKLLLIALVQASRVSELQALELKYWTLRPEGVAFVMPTLSKKRTVEVPPKKVMFMAYPNDSDLCVVQCLKQYEGVTQQHRNRETNRSQPLFLSYVSPHNPVTSQHRYSTLPGLKHVSAHWLYRLAVTFAPPFNWHQLFCNTVNNWYLRSKCVHFGKPSLKASRKCCS